MIQKLARHFNEEIKHAIIGRVITHVEQLIELLENFDKIGPSNTLRGENIEPMQRNLEEPYQDRQWTHATQQPSWRTQPSGGQHNKTGPTRYSAPGQSNTYNNTASRQVRQLEQNRGIDVTSWNRQADGTQWRNNQQPNFKVCNLEIEEERHQEMEEEGDTTQIEQGNMDTRRL